MASWPFAHWGLDNVGPIDPPSSSGHIFILAATDYVSKWAKVVPLKRSSVLRWLISYAVDRFSVLDQIISYNGPQFRSSQIDKLAEQLGFTWIYSTMNHPRANGLAEAFNKTLCNSLRKSISDTKRVWHKRLLKVLWAYCTTTRGQTQSTPLSLVYRGEVVLPLKIQLLFLRIALHYGMIIEEERVGFHCQELDALDEKRLQEHKNRM
ncbi:uncharacterized protein LOC110007675 [Amborella trichopoda]|uniref:uncharacterized protein LOC110007675 n=1 Tax=Amborella trichopoda TaxID=13333 RepID=UPI0009C15AAC|nr:uncharacterized protein LOC110007675 [Amborella trichopoda]|eukprot:XP_020525811.1 uncharacterized protein LOC110007675 [Amborella trichopoda]